MYSICRIATLHIKMHVFYMPDCHVAHKNAYILYRGCAGGTQGDPGHPEGSRRSWEQKDYKTEQINYKTIVFYNRKWRDRAFRVHETSATLTKHRKNAVGQRWPVAGGKWCMATGRGRNLEETIGKAARRHWEASGRHLEASCRYQVQGLRYIPGMRYKV